MSRDIPPAAPPPVADAEWDEVFRQLRPERLRTDGIRRALIIGAHPDDETIGAGRLIASLGLPSVALTATSGEACVVHPDVDAAMIATIRDAEWREAAEALGTTPLTTPRWPDGRLQEHTEELAELIDSELRDDDLLIVPWRHDPHPDHAAAGATAYRVSQRRQVKLVEYPVWATYWMTPHEVRDRGTTVRALQTDARAARRWNIALSVYRSQLHPLRTGWPPVVPNDVIDRHPEQLIMRAIADE